MPPNPSFCPIAIVGRSCVLPGALDPAALWTLIERGHVATAAAPDGRWGVRKDFIVAKHGHDSRDHAISDVGGYVDGFDGVFSPYGFHLPAEFIAALDPLFQWLLHTAREALREARYGESLARVGAVVGNLSYPSQALSRFAERIWLEAQRDPRTGLVGGRTGLFDARSSLPDQLGIPRVDPHNRFMSGLPAHLLAQGLGLGAGAFALDAACASSLYAIKLACDALADGRADLMLAGAVNRADDLFIHAGFTALGALSPTGRSRPFHAEADGLVPAEGAAMLALARLADAQALGLPIWGVIRGIGLSNDGRGRGLLVPSQAGQVRALQAAYAVAGVSPADVSLVECHATGTTVGDGVEIATLAQVFGGCHSALPIGSLKANLGHLITAAGAAGILKVLGAFAAGLRPATPSLTEPTQALGGAPLRALTVAEPWPDEGRPRTAAVSAFGFGGNNAHLILQEPPRPGSAVSVAVPAAPRTPQPLAVVAIGARVADGQSTADFAEALFTGTSRITEGAARAYEVALSMQGLRFPPKDLEETLPQQLLVFAAAREAVAQLRHLPADRTGVFIGMQCDAEIARHGARWRAAEWAKILNAPAGWLQQARDGFVPLLGAAGVVGAMPNIPANRMSSQYDMAGPSFTVSAEELSGVRALEVAQRALRAGEIDAAIVGAVDICAEPVHLAAAKVLSPRRQVGGDAGVVLVLKREEDARAAGERILCVLEADVPATPEATLRLGDQEGATPLQALFGHAHAASGLLHVAAAALCCAHGLRPGQVRSFSGQVEPPAPPRAWQEAARVAEVGICALGEQMAFVRLVADAQTAAAPENPQEVALWLAQLHATTERPAPPVIAFPAHRPMPHMPQLLPAEHPAPPAAPPLAAEDTMTAIMTMPTAPPLPSALAAFTNDAGAFAAREEKITAVPSAHERAPVMADAPAAPLAATAAPSSAAAPALGPPAMLPAFATHHLAYRHHVTQVHQAFVQQQTAVHANFLALRHSSFALLLEARSATPRRLEFAPTRPVPAATPIAAPTSASTRQELVRHPTGPTFSREQLQTHASGRISDIFGSAFAGQDEYALQVRMPEPPLLLADRVVGLQAEAGSMGLGTVWTETDVRGDSWFLNRGYMPAGIMIEAGQADLFLISYLGIDGLNRGARAYRLLGCELTYHGHLPKPGDTLRYEIHVDAHARQGDIRLFFFHYDCMIGDRRALTVRQGQAGFFSKEELNNSAGVLWRPEDQEINDQPRLDAPVAPCPARSFSAEQVQAFADGDAYRCFGQGFELAQTHTRSPAIQNDRMLLVGHIESFDPRGGPWERGYLKAVTPIAAGDWFFQGHFKNDPCMPGTLMFEGCLQAMAFYLAAMGYTLERDGWRFEPVAEVSFKLQCRGQVLPTSKQLVCELFVEEVHDGPLPTLYADLLGTVDGLKAFHARRVGLRLVPDWPLTSMNMQLPPSRNPSPIIDGFAFDPASLLACAWGRPSEAFGPMYAPFDGIRRVARLPGPPYHFMSRVARIDGELGACKAGGTIEIEYDVPVDAWYFRENNQRTMPYCVLLEAVLQPCGWLASFVGSALVGEQDLSFRNLDGTGTVFVDVLPEAGTLRTQTTLTSVSRSGGMILQTFDVRCFAGSTLVYELRTGFGFFPKAALENQVGLATSPAARALHDASSDFIIDLSQRPQRYCGGSARLSGPMLLMLDRVTAYDRNGGSAGIGFARAEKTVDSAEWFFKAHFFQDPVQPGSLGLEAMLSLLQFVMLHEQLHEGMTNPRFESIARGVEMTWKYRGQVVPRNRTITTTLEVTRRAVDDEGQPTLWADASLWVDGKRIYHATSLAMRLVHTREAEATPPTRPAAVTWKPEALLPDVRALWQGVLGQLPPPVDDVFFVLIRRFLNHVRVENERTLTTLAQAPRGVLFLANHQTAIESSLFAIVVSALTGAPIVTLAKPEVQEAWLEKLFQHLFAYPGIRHPKTTKYFDRSDSRSLPAALSELSAGMRRHRRSVMVYVEGTRALSCSEPVRTLSGTFIDMALDVDCPIVPVKLVGGLPRTPLAERTDLPVGLGQQAIVIGTPILPEALRPLHYGARRTHVLTAINDVGPSPQQEEPFPADRDLQAAAEEWASLTGASFGHAVVLRLLMDAPALCPELRVVVDAARSGGDVSLPDTPHGTWLAELARRLLGPGGPIVRIQGA